MREARDIQSERILEERSQPNRKAKKRLAKAREQLALVSSAGSFGFWRWSGKADKVWASKHARRILGVEARTVLTRELLLSMIHPADRVRISQAVASTSSHADIVELELRLGQGAKTRWVTIRARAHRNAGGKISRVLGYVVDESNAKRAEAQFLKQQQQITHLTRVAMLGELSGAIAHELQQPLTAVRCNAETAQHLASGPDFKIEDLREILTDIINDNHHAGQLIQRLRSLLIRGELQLQRLEIGDLVGKVLALCRGTLKERNVQVELRIAEGLPEVMGARVELQQVLLNLILNASDSMSGNAPPDRRIEIDISFDAARSLVRASVLDQGKGIEEDDLDRIFEPFFTTKASGLGLGLAVSRSIMTAHKGRLWATRRSGRGAAFHFTLPVAPA
jgi:C4-dicarboxylate-specific signal transduction histidine kinase